MSLFTSKRERRLWIMVIVVVVAIYSTLGLASTLASELNNRGLNAAFFGFSMVLVIATILTQGLKSRPGGTELFVGLGLATIYLLVLLRMVIPEHRSHLIEYSILAVFIYQALMERSNNGGNVPFPPLIALLITSLLGVLDECIQAFLPSRVFDPVDMLFNFLAGLMAVVGSVLLDWIRKRRTKS